MVDYCEEVLVTIRSAPDETALDQIVRDSVLRFMRTRTRQDVSRYVINMIAHLHSAVNSSTSGKERLVQAIELFKAYQLRDLESFLCPNEI